MPTKYAKRDPYSPEFPIVKIALLVEPNKTFDFNQLSKMTEYRIDRVKNTLRKFEIVALDTGEFSGRDIIQAAKAYLASLEP